MGAGAGPGAQAGPSAKRAVHLRRGPEGEGCREGPGPQGEAPPFLAEAATQVSVECRVGVGSWGKVWTAVGGGAPAWPRADLAHKRHAQAGAEEPLRVPPLEPQPCLLGSEEKPALLAGEKAASPRSDPVSPALTRSRAPEKGDRSRAEMAVAADAASLVDGKGGAGGQAESWGLQGWRAGRDRIVVGGVSRGR